MRCCAHAALLALCLALRAPAASGNGAPYDPLDPSADHKAHAIELDEAGDLEGAIRSFRQAATFAPGVTDHWNNLGIALMDEENPRKGYGANAEAAVAFNRAVRAAPTNQWAKDNLQDAAVDLLREAGLMAGSVAAAKAAAKAAVEVDASGAAAGAAAGGEFPFPAALLPRFHARADWRDGGDEPFAGLFPALLPPRAEGWPFDDAKHMARADEAADAEFYAQPRLVTHVDDAAIAALRSYYGATLGQGDEVLEIAASWVSHLPTSFRPARLAGVGMNAAEMGKNPALTEWVERDLNALPFAAAGDSAVDVAQRGGPSVGRRHVPAPRGLRADRGEGPDGGRW
jgi:tetratricopeptide (TPR) repeat protein